MNNLCICIYLYVCISPLNVYVWEGRRVWVCVCLFPFASFYLNHPSGHCFNETGTILGESVFPTTNDGPGCFADAEMFL